MFGQNDPRYPLPDLDVLLVEDAASLRAIYEPHLRRAGLDTHCAATASDALSLFQRHRMKLVLIDLSLHDRDGFDLLADILALQPETAVVVIAAERSTEQAVRAMRAGALDFLVKPISEERLSEVIESARQLAQQRADHDSRSGGAPLGEFIGRSPRMQQVYGHMRAAARSQAPLLISGEIGTGKKLAAQCIHALSAYGSDGFQALDCAALTPELLEEATLTAPRAQRPDGVGLIGGTLFLDNIDEMSAPTQSRLLDIMQNHGDGKTGLPHGLRLISACAAAPTALVTEAGLRRDLFYRLNVLTLTMVPLRLRREDITPIARTLLHRIAMQEGRPGMELSPAAISAIEAYDWPGNVREMINALRSALVLNDGPELTPEMLPGEIGNMPAHPYPEIPAHQSLSGLTLAEVEKLAIRDALARHDGAVAKAAAELGVAPSTIYRKLGDWRKA